MEALIGKKMGMTQIFQESGRAEPVSVIQLGPCPVVQIKTTEKDGYSAVQIGFEPVKESRTTRPYRGHFKSAKIGPHRILREVRVDDVSGFKVGESLGAKLFEDAKEVHIAGVTKGCGFAGVTKRHGFKGGKETHGCKNHRVPGAVGNCATPSRIFKGKKLAGRMGGARMTVKNLKVIQVDVENNLLFVRGAVPGGVNGILFVRKK